MKTIDEAEQLVGRIVGFTHGNELQLPDDYVKYNGPPSPLKFIERFNYDYFPLFTHKKAISYKLNCTYDFFYIFNHFFVFGNIIFAGTC